MNVLELDGKPIVWLWPKAFSEADVAHLVSLEDWPRVDCLGHIVDRPHLANYLGMLFHQRMPEFDCEGWSPRVTFSSSEHPIPWHHDHLDPHDGAKTKFKVFTYLNAASIGGGTRFGHIDGEQITVPPEKGTIVMFDIEVAHCSESIPQGFRKKTLGIRPRGVSLNGSDPRSGIR